MELGLGYVYEATQCSPFYFYAISLIPPRHKALNIKHSMKESITDWKRHKNNLKIFFTLHFHTN